jgi:RNA polymerase sigma-70 factor (ECF subfamily)
VRQAFGRLKPRERQLLWLAYVQGCNHEEIAHCTGLQAGSIRLLLFRARHRMVDLIGGWHRGHRQAEKEVRE